MLIFMISFKMHMRPSSAEINSNGLTIKDLPPWTTNPKVMGDFLRYLYQETLGFIKERHSDSEELLKCVTDRTSLILSHPNGWTGLPQQHMREAAIFGGLVKDMADGLKKIRFVSEGEASALSCLASGLCTSGLKVRRTEVWVLCEPVSDTIIKRTCSLEIAS